ncbi:MAG: threonylcarbamoyl-AMP synthase [Deltaproteobacteria bacterium]|nr:MAG: threonylcarbamoyl-AMP synthase [Deltaproteobacteria bacterium]
MPGTTTRTSVRSATPQSIETAARALRAGALVAFPTETVYGLGARADDPHAVARIFAAKGRPADHPLIVHVAEASALAQIAASVPPSAWTLAERFWPGPLTLVLPKAPSVPPEVTGGLDTVAVRVPAHPVARALLQAAQVPVAAPSANRFGRTSPTTAAHVQAEFGDTVAYVLDGGPCTVGLESTIVDLSGATPAILRPGGIPRVAVEAALGTHLNTSNANRPRAPGSLPAHYAPAVPLEVVPAADLERYVADHGDDLPVGLLAFEAPPFGDEALRFWAMPADPVAYGRLLYARLREAESCCGRILVASPPEDPAWEAVWDRLRRAAIGARSTETPREVGRG